MIDCDDNASVSTDAVSQASSSSSSLFTFQADRHSTAISRLGRARSVADQLQDLAHQDSPADLAELHKIFVGKETFVLESSTKRRKKRSKIDAFGIRLTKIDGAGNRRGDYWVCSKCDQAGNPFPYLLSNGGTSGARNHLRRDHCLLLKAGGDGGDGETTSESIESEPPRKRQRTLEDSFKNKPVVSKAIDEVFRETLLGWIASADLPFTAVEHPDFINLLRHLNAKLVNELLPQSGDTIKTWMKLEYGAMKEELKCQLALSPYKKHVTFDLWTSPNSYTLLGVNAHFADLTGKLCSELLSLKRVYGAHTGDNIGELLRAVIADFEISDTLGYTVSDNAKNNDDAVTKLLELTLPDEEPTPRRLRCGNHIIKLSATAFNVGKLSKTLARLPADSDERKELQEALHFLAVWRPTGPLARLRKYEVWVSGSTQRKDAFLDATNGKISEGDKQEFGEVLWDISELGGLNLVKESNTRWNSIYNAVARALRLQGPIGYHQSLLAAKRSADKRPPEDCFLSADDWHYLAIYFEVLKPFKVLTKKFEGNKPTFAELAGELHWLLEKLREFRTIYSENLVNAEITAPEILGPETEIRVGDQGLAGELPQAEQSQRSRRTVAQPARIQECELGSPEQEPRAAKPPDRSILVDLPNHERRDLCDDNLRGINASLLCAIYKLEKYVKKLEDSPAYWAAMILHPGHKTKWITQSLKEDHREHVVAMFKELFKEEYQHLAPAPAPEPDRSPTSHLVDDDYYDPPEDLAKKDEIKAYFELPQRPVADPLAWWIARKDEYPRLAKMALDYLTIPSTACECERCFSRTKLTIGTQRHSLRAETVEMLACLKIWVRNKRV